MLVFPATTIETHRDPPKPSDSVRVRLKELGCEHSVIEEDPECSVSALIAQVTGYFLVLNPLFQVRRGQTFWVVE